MRDAGWHRRMNRMQNTEQRVQKAEVESGSPGLWANAILGPAKAFNEFLIGRSGSPLPDAHRVGVDQCQAADCLTYAFIHNLKCHQARIP